MNIINNKNQISNLQNKYRSNEKVIVFEITNFRILDYFNNDLSFYLRRVGDNILPQGIIKIEVISNNKFAAHYDSKIISTKKVIEFFETLDL